MIDKDGLRALLAAVDARLQSPVSLLLVGGAAVLALCEDAAATRDLDAFPGPGLGEFERGLAEAVRLDGLEPVDLNDRSRMFESLLPEGWEGRVRLASHAGTRRIRLLTPSPEDLAVMKVFRYRAKDAEDIARLAALPGFDLLAFRRGFEATLPVATGDPAYHARSFCLAWNALDPGSPLGPDDLLRDLARARPPRRRPGGA